MPNPSIGALFRGFLGLGLTGFGGVLPLARRMIVEDKAWLNGDEFTELLGLCQFLPGGNIINMSVAIGMKFQGGAGALAAITGLMVAPTAIVIGLGSLYGNFRDNPLFGRVIAGLAAAAAGLLVATAVKMALPLIRRPGPLLVAAITLGAIAFLRTPLLPSMAVLAPIGMLVSREARP